MAADLFAERVDEARRHLADKGWDHADAETKMLAALGWLGDRICQANGRPRNGRERAVNLAQRGGWPVALAAVLWALADRLA